MLRNGLIEKEQNISGKRTVSKKTIINFTVIIYQYWFLLLKTQFHAGMELV